MARKSSTAGTTGAAAKAASKPKAAKGARAKSANGDAESPPKRRTSQAQEGRSTAGSGKALVIVESPKKARSINKFLGPGYIVKASMGHVRDLPEKGFGLDIERGFSPTYVIIDKKKATIADLRKDADKASTVYLATDPDREGEAIAWHLQHALGIEDSRAQRVRFFEITERGIRDAFQNPTAIDLRRVDAQQARRFLDRIIGYKLSPWLRKKVFHGQSAGRVQSVALRLIAEREREIQAFVSEEYWEIDAALFPQGGNSEADRYEAKLVEWEGSPFKCSNEADARRIRDALASLPYTVTKVDPLERKDRPDAPFKTSTLQQQASVRFRFSGTRTMKIAQELYEGIDTSGEGPVGLITYMRTDSLRVSDEAIQNVRSLIAGQYGQKYLPGSPNQYAAGKNAQEAHEAIRPTDLALTPESIQGKLSPEQFKLYQLIYRRFVASQMNPAVFAVTNVEIEAGKRQGVFKTQGRILVFDGYRRVLAPAGKQEDSLLPTLSVGQSQELLGLDPSQHFTQPPPRYTEATLIKALEKENIGRPSTYAAIIQKIQDREYVEQQERRFHATQLGLVVSEVLVENFPKVMDMKFTSHMEDELDLIAEGKAEMVSVLDEFYRPLQEDLKTAEVRVVLSSEKCPKCGAPMEERFNKWGKYLRCTVKECKTSVGMDGKAKPDLVLTEHLCPKCSKPLAIREGKRGKFLSCSGYPKCKETFEIGPDGGPLPRESKETEHACPKCGKPMLLRQGPRGPFLGCSAYPKCKSTMPLNDKGEPVAPVKIDVKCTKCGGPMGIKQSRRGPFLGCLAYPKCRSTAPIPEELKETHPELFVKAEPVADGLKDLEITEVCPQCGGPMKARRGRGGSFFLGCTKYPKCKGTKEPEPETLERIQAATAQPPSENVA